MANPIVFRVTDVGKNAILDSQNTGLTLRIAYLAVGVGQYLVTGGELALVQEVNRYPLSDGGVNLSTHTLKLTAQLRSDEEMAIYEVGVFTDDNVLFAVASSVSQPLLRVFPDVVVVGSFGLTIDGFDVDKVQVVVDSSGAVASLLMKEHLSHADPHPQYADKKATARAFLGILSKIGELVNRRYEAIPVGGIFTTTVYYANSEAVNQALGYGRWQQVATGEVLVGASSALPSSQDAFAIGKTGGNREHQLTVEQLPSHKHGQNGIFNRFVARANELRSSAFYGGGLISPKHNDEEEHTEIATSGFNNQGWSAMVEQSVGGNQKFSLMQPYRVVAYWLRLPDDYVPANYRVYWTSDSAGNDKISGIQNGQNAYLWFEIANQSNVLAVTPMLDSTVGRVGVGGMRGDLMLERLDFSLPPAVGNGKHRVAQLLASEYDVIVSTDVSMGVSFNVNGEQRQILSRLQVQTNSIARFDATVRLNLQSLDYYTDNVILPTTETLRLFDIVHSGIEAVEFSYEVLSGSSSLFGGDGYGLEYQRRVTSNEIIRQKQSNDGLSVNDDFKLLHIWLKLPYGISQQSHVVDVQTNDDFSYEFVQGRYDGFSVDTIGDANRQHQNWLVLRLKLERVPLFRQKLHFVQKMFKNSAYRIDRNFINSKVFNISIKVKA